MNHRIQDIIDRVLTLAPMPPEAYPGGAVGRIPAVRSTMELAWQNMALVMLTAGFIAGVLLAVLFFLAVVFKTSFPSLLKAMAHAQG